MVRARGNSPPEPSAHPFHQQFSETFVFAMEALPSNNLFRFPFSVKSLRCMELKDNELSNNAIAIDLKHRFPLLTVKKWSRRLLLQFIGVKPILLYAYPVFGVPMLEMKEPEVIRTVKLASGVIIQEIIEGEGREVHEGDLVEVNYVCMRSNGYFVHSTVDQFSGESTPVILPLDGKQIIKGLKEVLTGMKAGGKRRALIPPSAGYINENLKPMPEEFGPRRSLLSHIGEPLIFEVQLLKVV